jgi:hypothetical protein
VLVKLSDLGTLLVMKIVNEPRIKTKLHFHTTLHCNRRNDADYALNFRWYTEDDAVSLQIIVRGLQEDKLLKQGVR